MDGKSSVIRSCQTGYDLVCSAIWKAHKEDRVSFVEIAGRASKHYGKRISDSTISRLVAGWRDLKKSPGQTDTPNALKGNFAGPKLEAIGKAVGVDLTIHHSADGVLKYCDPLLQPDRMRELGDARREAEKDAKFLYTFAHFLPCSLETADFMKMHHQALYRRAFAMMPNQRAKMVEAYNNFGIDSQRRLPSRTFEYWHHMFYRDIEDIAHGRGTYEKIPPEVRKGCLDRLLTLVGPKTLRPVRVFLAEEQDLDQDASDFLREMKSLWINDDRLVAWTTTRGSLYWTQDSAEVKLRSEVLGAFREAASVREPREIEAYLRNLLRVGKLSG